MNYITEIIILNDRKYRILIGKNAIGNDLIISMSNPTDVWIHFSEISGPHLIIQKIDNIDNFDKIDKKNLKQISLLLYKYKKKAPQSSKIIYTQIKNIEKTNILGTVIPKTYKKL